MPDDLRTCHLCKKALAPAAVYHRFRLVLEAEQDLGEAADAAESPADLLARIEREGDWDRYEAEVHRVIDGILCGACRAELERVLG